MARQDFSHRSLSGSSRGRGKLILATALIFLLFGIDALFGGPVRNGVRAIAATMWAGAVSVRASVGGSGVFARNSTLAQENQRLARELASVQERAAAYGALKDENESLRAMLHFSQVSQGVAAPVVSSYHASPYGTFMIAASRNDAIAPGDIALSETGFVVGRVADVGDTHTLVRSVFQSGTAIDVIIGNAAVTARGEGGGNAYVEVPRGIDVRPGDAVTAPAYGGHPVGIVGKVEEVTTTAELKVYIVLPVNLSLLKFVYVIPAP